MRPVIGFKTDEAFKSKRIVQVFNQRRGINFKSKDSTVNCISNGHVVMAVTNGLQ